MGINLTNFLKHLFASVRAYALFAICFFLVTFFFAATLVIPNINKAFTEQYEAELSVELALEKQLFERFIESKRSLLQDLAEFPSIANAVMIAEFNHPDVLGFLENVKIDGQKGRLFLQDIEGNILAQTSATMPQSLRGQQKWQLDLLEGEENFTFQILSQSDDKFTYQISVPVLYHSFTEGTLSAVITTDLNQVFPSQVSNNNVGFRVQTGAEIVQTNLEKIRLPKELSVKVGNPELTLTYISDFAPIQAQKQAISFQIFSVLLSSLFISVLAITVFAYWSTLKKDEHINSVKRPLKNYALPIIVGLLGCATSLTAFLLTTNLQNSLIEDSNYAESRLVIETIQEKIDDSISALEAMNAFYKASETVTRSEFKNFSSPLLENNTDILTLDWVPYVENSERLRIEIETRKSGFPDFEFKEVNDAKKLISAKERDAYFPILFSEPPAHKETALGFDLGSHQESSIALNQAYQSKGKAATSPINMVQARERKIGILIFNPVYENQSTIFDAQENLKGFSLMGLNLENLFTETAANFDSSLDIFVSDISSPEKSQSIFGAPTGESHKTYQGVVEVAGRVWRVTTTNSNMDVPYKWLPLSSLITGLLLTFIIVGGLVYLIQRRNIVEDIVDQRTSELNHMVGKLTDSNEELSRFAYVCSHDLQEPLRMIRSFSEKLEMHLEGRLKNDEKGKKYFKFVTSGAERAQSLISDILAYSAVSSDTQRFTSVSCETLLESIKVNMTANLEANHGRITNDPLPDMHGHKTQLFQLFQNLINNGLKYHRPGGDAPHVHIGVEELEMHWKVSVKDNGIGMEEKHLNKIFDVFQRLNRQSQYAGTGVGLSICKKVVERHGGMIWAESTLGIGSTFYFTIAKP